MRNIYDQEMREIHRDSITMCNLAAEALQDALEAVRRRDFTMAKRVQDQDQHIRAMRMGINERVMRMIATQHPVAVDLRKLFYLIHMADEMERVGFEAWAICRAMLRTEQGNVLLMEDLYRMGERTCTMFESTLTGTLGENVEAVLEIIRRDDEVDVLSEQIYRECASRQGTGIVAKEHEKEDIDVMTTIHMARYIEHAADHIVNWCRWWLYFIPGRDERGGEIIV